jgi:hypothetical protein
MSWLKSLSTSAPEERRHEGILAALGDGALVARHDAGEGLEVGAAGIAGDAGRLGVERGVGRLLVARLELVHQRVGGDVVLVDLGAVDRGLQVADDRGALAHEEPDFLRGLLGVVLGDLRRGMGGEQGQREGGGASARRFVTKTHLESPCVLFVGQCRKQASTRLWRPM